ATSFKDKLGLGTRSTAGPLQSMSLFFPDTEENADVGMSEIIQTPSSKESSPSHAHTRTGSLDMSDLPNLTLPKSQSTDSVFTSSAAADLGYSETPTPSHTQENNDNSYKLENSSCPADHTTSSASPVSCSADAIVENAAKADTFDPKRLNDTQKLDIQLLEEQVVVSMRKERSFSGGGFDLSSPSHTKKRHGSGMRNNMSASRLRYVQNAPTNQVADFTIFLIPGLDVKVHYNSKTVSGDSPVTSINGSSKYCSDADFVGLIHFQADPHF
ncbi:uncharacterized protein KIAA1109, partial [Caerostris extrusa]